METYKKGPKDEIVVRVFNIATIDQYGNIEYKERLFLSDNECAALMDDIPINSTFVDNASISDSNDPLILSDFEYNSLKDDYDSTSNNGFFEDIYNQVINGSHN